MTNDYLVIGKIGSTYGIKGWLKIVAYTEFAASVFEYKTWYIENPTGWQPIKVESGKPHGKGIIAKLEGYDNPEVARLLSGKKFAIFKNQLPALQRGEYYWSDLIGLIVIDQHNEILGQVIYLLETGTNDVLVVKGITEHAIPYLPGDVITSVDLENKEIHVNWEML